MLTTQPAEQLPHDSPEVVKPIVIRAIEPDDRAVWEPLWNGYLDFYGKHISQETTDSTWQRLTRSDDIHGLIAVNRNLEGIGIVHFFYHPSTSAIGGNCYIQDLFVSVSARRCGVGRKLVLGAVEAARKRGAAVVYWQTEEFNTSARRLYERIAKRSPFIRYNIEL
jgi:GNAT superfamily N-acetyltransferase